MKKLFFAIILICYSLLGTPVIIDLTSVDNSGTISGAIFQQGSEGSGTGIYVDFVQLQNTGIEQGYNTSYRPNQFDEGSVANFNRDIQLRDLPVITQNDQRYIIFGLDVNESNNQESISLDSLIVFISETGNRTGYPNLGTMIYNMDSSDQGNTILIDSSLSHGSGTSDMMFYLPTNLLTDFDSTDYLYLYSSFGGYNSDWSANAGAEQWEIDENTLPRYNVPEPSGIIFILLSIMMLLPVCTGRVRGEESIVKTYLIESKVQQFPEISVSSDILEGDMVVKRIVGIDGILLDITAIRKKITLQIAKKHIFVLDAETTVRIGIGVRHVKRFIALEVVQGTIIVGEQLLQPEDGAFYVVGITVLPNAGALSFIDAVRTEATAYTQSQLPGLTNEQITQLRHIRLDGYRAINDSAIGSGVLPIYEPPFVSERPIGHTLSSSGLP